MSNLSWLIYLLQVLDGFRNFCLAALMGSIVLAAALLFLLFPMVEYAKPEDWVTWRRWWRVPFIAIPLSAFLLIFVPSRETVLLIAGSEIGQMVVQSEQAQSMKDSILNPGVDLLKTWIEQETQRLKKGN